MIRKYLLSVIKRYQMNTQLELDFELSHLFYRGKFGINFEKNMSLTMQFI